LIAKYCDAKLRSSKVDDNIESILDSVLVLFQYINGKDVFEAFYKKDLAKRLIFARSSSSDTEKYLIAKLKSECGSGFTMKVCLHFIIF
jgi:cullin-4